MLTTEVLSNGLKMKLSKWLENWDLSKLHINAGFLKMEWAPKDADKDAAWELYIELLTRITTQPLDDTAGDEKSALDSVFSIFPITRDVIKHNGRDCIQFTKLAVIVLNQIIRPFTAKWHKLSQDGAFEDDKKKFLFRKELIALQKDLGEYSRMLADMADVEDLTNIEK